jgi:hypothetical protein
MLFPSIAVWLAIPSDHRDEKDPPGWSKLASHPMKRYRSKSKSILLSVDWATAFADTHDLGRAELPQHPQEDFHAIHNGGHGSHNSPPSRELLPSLELQIHSGLPRPGREHS